MKFLAINTAGKNVEVALHMDGAIHYKCATNARKANEVLFLYIDELMTNNTVPLTLTDLDFLAVVSGPGSFTGIRIGVSAVRTLAQMTNLKVLPLTFFDVLSYNNKGISAIDAANGLYYVKVSDGEIEIVKEAELDDYISKYSDEFVLCVEPQFETSKLSTKKQVKKYSLSGSELVGSCLQEFNKNGLVNYDQVIPLYIRKPQAEENL